MYPVSDTVKALFAAEQAQVLRITGHDRHNNPIEITDADVVMGSFNIDRYSCNGQKLEIGTAIASEMTMKLNNADGKYDNILFESAELFVEIGIADWTTQETPVISYIPCGYFTPDVQSRKLDTISIKALDRMTRFDSKPSKAELVPWTDNNGNEITDNNGNVIYFYVGVSLPCTVANLIEQMCERCSVPLATSISNLPNASYSVVELPIYEERTTFRNLIQWCAGIMGTNAWVDWNGELRFSFYNNATGYVTTTANRYSSDLYENPITITGVQWTDPDEVVHLAGVNRYVLDLTNNGMLTADNAAVMLTNVYNAVGNYAYTPFSAEVIAAPYLWPMDRISFTDKDGNGHVTTLTNVNLGVNGHTSIAGVGETAQQAIAMSPSSFTQQQQARLKRIQRETSTEIDGAVQNATAQITGADGGYVRFIYDANGKMTEIVIMNTDDITTATKVWRWNSGGLGYSSNGYAGPYTTAITQDGSIVANFITSGAMSANRISGGTIDGTTVLAKLLNIIDDDNNVIASFDDTIILGRANSFHSEIDYNSFEMYDVNGNAFMSVGDMRDADGKATLTQNYTGSGSQTLFGIRFPVDSASDVTVTVDGIETSNWVLQGQQGIRFNQAPADGASVTITYITHKPLYHYDFGVRKTNDINEIGQRSVVEGTDNIAEGADSHAEGHNTEARGAYSHAEGYATVASGSESHAEGYDTEASGNASHAEGYQTVASGVQSHAEGHNTEASGGQSHAEGYQTVASGGQSHAEGEYTEARGAYSHAEGYDTEASGNASHAEGIGTIANKSAQHVVGWYNVPDSAGADTFTYLEIVGNGSENSRLNIRTLDYNGNEWIGGTLTQASDNRLKDECGEVPDVSGVKARMFRWNDKKLRHDDKVHLGYFAQDVEKVAPYLVAEDDMGYKSLDYIGFLVAKIASLERRVAELEKKLSEKEV